MESYQALLRHVLTTGTVSTDRTGTGTLSVFGAQFRHDLAAGFPLLTTKNVHFHSVLHELLWFIRGDTNIRYLKEHGVTIWNEWADENGDLGPVYGAQWRHRGGIDQLEHAIHQIRHTPDSRRIIVSAWNVADLPAMRLPPCHLLYQFHVRDGRLSCQVYQRSADLFLGVPFNIASYALLTHLIAQLTGLQPGELILTFGDLHLYQNHLKQARLQLTRLPAPLPRLHLSPEIAPDRATIDDIRAHHIALTDYHPHPTIKAPIAV